MPRPSEGDMIQKIQELKATASAMKKRAEAAEILLIEMVAHAESGNVPPDGTITQARNLIRELPV